MPNIRIPAGYRLTVDDLRAAPGGLHPTFIALAKLGAVKSYDKGKQLIRDGILRQPYRVGDRDLSEARDLLKLLDAPLLHPDDAASQPLVMGHNGGPPLEMPASPRTAHEPRVAARAPPNSTKCTISQAGSTVR